MFRPIVAAALFSVFPAVASAAIVFEPVQYQYRNPVQDRPAFYYGGSNPAAFIAGVIHQQRYAMGANPVQDIGFRNQWVGPLTDDLLHHSAWGSFTVTYSDLLPPGMNAFPLGLTPDDARNDAYNNVPRYFRKRDLLGSAVRLSNRQVAIPAQAPLPGTLEMMPAHGWPTTQPATQTTQPHPVLIIPKGLLERKLNSVKPTPVASAD
jgi:hypothetical protein